MTFDGTLGKCPHVYGAPRETDALLPDYVADKPRVARPQTVRLPAHYPMIEGATLRSRATRGFRRVSQRSAAAFAEIFNLTTVAHAVDAASRDPLTNTGIEASCTVTANITSARREYS